MKRMVYGTLWIAVYLLLTCTPLFVMLLGTRQPGRDFWRELSVALGFAGLAMMGMQFLLTARFQTVTRPYGIDVVYHFHRQISTIAFLLVIAHPLILFASSPSTLALLNPFSAPLRATLGVLAVILLILLIAFSIKRKAFRLNYEAWRISHGLLAVAVVILAMAHTILVGYHVNTPGKQALWIAFGAFWILALLYVRVYKPLWMLRRPYQVDQVLSERGDTYSLVLSPVGHGGMRFQPGQFAWLTIRRSPFAVPEHPFSFSSSAMDSSHVEISIKELGDFTSTVKDIAPGTRAYLDGPYGSFSIDAEIGAGFVFLAGGVGITPFVSMLRTMADRRDQRPVLLFYGSQTWEDTSFRDTLQELQSQVNLQVVHVLSQPDEGWTGETGFITAALMARYLPPERLTYEYFTCGPDVMMKAVDAALQQLGIPADCIHSEHFNFV